MRGKLLDRIGSKLKSQSDRQQPSYQQPPPPPPPPPQQAGNGFVFELDSRQQRIWADERAEYLRQERERELLAEKLHNEALQRKLQESKMLAIEQERLAADKRRMERARNASSESIRRLRELIREKYRLDIFVWSERDGLEEDRDLIVAECEKADRILQEIYWIVEEWDEAVFEPEEWKVAEKIKKNLLQKDQHAIWGDIPPWDREDTEQMRRQFGGLSI